jgi:hypothetical protein
MTTQCRHCESQLEQGATICAQCGQATDVPAPLAPSAPPTEFQPTPAIPDQPTAAPLFSAMTESANRGLTGIGGWLILPAIGLAINPFVALFGVAACFFLLFGNAGQIMIARKPGIEKVIVFEIVMDLLFLILLILLNILFYNKKKSLPMFMIIFFGLQFVLLLADHLMAAQFNPHSSPLTVIRSFVICAIWIPYFLRSERVKLTFVN